MGSQACCVYDISVDFEYVVNWKDYDSRKFMSPSSPIVIFDSKKVCPRGKTKDTFTVYRLPKVEDALKKN